MLVSIRSHEKSSSNATTYKEYPVRHITILLILANDIFTVLSSNSKCNKQSHCITLEAYKQKGYMLLIRL